MTVEQLYNIFIKDKKQKIKPNTLANIQTIFNTYILPTFKDCKIHKITTKMLEDWQSLMNEKKLLFSTKSIIFYKFKQLFNYAQKKPHVYIDKNENPFNDLKNFFDDSLPKNMQFYKWEEFKIFITNARNEAIKKELQSNNLSEWDYYVFFNIAFYTGLRKGEIFALKWSDINLDAGLLSVTRTLTQKKKGFDIETRPKNKSSIRIIKMPLPLISILKEQLKRQQSKHNFSNDFRICGGVRNGTLENRNKLYSKGLKTIRIHDFRHSHASLLASKGVNIQEISRRLGHSRVEITWRIYCHLYPDEEKSAVNILNKLV